MAIAMLPVGLFINRIRFFGNVINFKVVTVL
jgi:hypothetical protein